MVLQFSLEPQLLIVVSQISLMRTRVTIHQLKKKNGILELCFFLFSFSVNWEKNIVYSCISIVLSNHFTITLISDIRL